MRKENQKKRSAFFLAALLLLSACLSPIVSARETGKSWYITRNREHKQPLVGMKDEELAGYDAYYVDRAHGDESEEKVIYLTFDAGYENGNIARILDVLQENDVSAAFFVLKHLITHDAALVERMIREGHLVCNHTMRHPDMTRLDDAAFTKELEELAALYKDSFGKEMARYYRPPEGKYTERDLALAKKLGYKTIFWSFAYADWDNDRQPDPKVAKQKIRDNIHNGAVLLLHPTSATNAEILSELITEWKNAGYRFGTLDELTGE